MLSCRPYKQGWGISPPTTYLDTLKIISIFMVKANGEMVHLTMQSPGYGVVTCVEAKLNILKNMN